MRNIKKYLVLNTFVSACDYEFLLNKIREVIRKKTLIISPITSQTTVDSLQDEATQKKINQIDYLPPDSQWVRFALRLLYQVKLKDRVYGPQLMLRICQTSQEYKYKIFLYGTTPNTLKKLTANLNKMYPEIFIAGSLAPKFGKLTDREVGETAKKIYATRTDIIFLGLGSPYRELFALQLKEEFHKLNYYPVIIPIGAAFDFIAGSKKQAPKWIGDIGLEWLFRLTQEPQRLWKRYLFSGPLFIALVIRQKIKI